MSRAVGKARLYRDHPDYGGEVDPAKLIEHLAAYDGWALSTSALGRRVAPGRERRL
jgi:hypothetical protein